MKHFKKLNAYNGSETVKDLHDVVSDIIQERRNDVIDFDNLQNVFIKGRKVGKIPTSSTDVTASDRIGDFNYSATYLYLCVDNSGAAWRRIALATW